MKKPIIIGLLSMPRERSIWMSMEEVLPALDSAWNAAAQKLSPNSKLIRMTWSGKNARQLFDQAMKCDLLVLPYPNPRLIRILREGLNYSGRFAIHVHGHGARLFRRIDHPERWLRQKDLFICASQAEYDAIKLCFPKGVVSIVPHPIPSQWENFRPLSQGTDKVLVYVGRVSEQKNLHTLLWSIQILKTKYGLDQKIEIYGKPDGYGSPFMGLTSSGYGKRLHKLAKDLGIEKQITWKGFQARENIRKELSGRPHIFVSPSLHLYEDFGIAALNSISLGAQAVLSAWGGHNDFSKNFKDQVRTVPVFASPVGPYVSPADLAQIIFETARSARFMRKNDLNSILEKKYSVTSAGNKIARAVLARNPNGNLKSSSIRDRILSKWKRPKIEIYDGYQDRRVDPVLSCYGMTKAKKPSQKRLMRQAPWVKRKGLSVQVDDPHRGIFRYRARSEKDLDRWLSKRGWLIGFFILVIVRPVYAGLPDGSSGLIHEACKSICSVDNCLEELRKIADSPEVRDQYQLTLHLDKTYKGALILGDYAPTPEDPRLIDDWNSRIQSRLDLRKRVRQQINHDSRFVCINPELNRAYPALRLALSIANAQKK